MTDKAPIIIAMLILLAALPWLMQLAFLFAREWFYAMEDCIQYIVDHFRGDDE